MRRSSRVLVAGLVLLVIGIGNYVMGDSKMQQYADRLIYALELGGPEVRTPFRGTASILEERTAAHELYADSSTKYEYYRVVRRGGTLLMALGGILVAGALVRRVVVPAQA